MDWRKDNLLFLLSDQTEKQGQSNGIVEWTVARFTTEEHFI